MLLLLLFYNINYIKLFLTCLLVKLGLKYWFNKCLVFRWFDVISPVWPWLIIKGWICNNRFWFEPMIKFSSIIKFKFNICWSNITKGLKIMGKDGFGYNLNKNELNFKYSFSEWWGFEFKMVEFNLPKSLITYTIWFELISF